MPSLTSKNKINHTDLPVLVGQSVTVRSNVDNSEKRGIVGFYDSVKNYVRVDFNRSSFWVQTVVNDASQYVYIQ